MAEPDGGLNPAGYTVTYIAPKPNGAGRASQVDPIGFSGMRASG